MRHDGRFADKISQVDHVKPPGLYSADVCINKGDVSRDRVSRILMRLCYVRTLGGLVI